MNDGCLFTIITSNRFSIAKKYEQEGKSSYTTKILLCCLYTQGGRLAANARTCLIHQDLPTSVWQLSSRVQLMKSCAYSCFAEVL